MKHLPVCAALLGAAMGGVCPAAGATTLQDLVDETLENNPAVQGAEAQWLAASAGAEAADAWPDPTLAYGYFIEPVETRVGPQEHKVMLNQAIPWFGTPGLRRRVKEADANASLHRHAGEVLRSVYEVKATVYEHAYLEELVALTEENIALVQHLEGVAQARLRGGEDAAGAVKAQLELGRLTDRLASLRDRYGPLEARLNAVLGRPADVEAPWPATLPYPEAGDVPGDDPLTSLESSPAMEILGAARAAEAARVALARRASYPDLLVGLDYTAIGDAMDPSASDSGKDAVMAKVGIRLPLWFGRNRAEIAEARHRQAAADRGYEDGLNRLRVRLEQAARGFRDARRKTLLYRETLLPQARYALELAEQNYRAGASGFLDLIDAQRLLLELQESYHRARADTEIRRAEIEMITAGYDQAVTEAMPPTN